MVDTASIPRELHQAHQWTCWTADPRIDHGMAYPVDPRVGEILEVEDTLPCDSFDVARQAMDDDATIDGVGFVVNPVYSFRGLSLPNCRDPDSGEPTPVAKAIIDGLHSYTEVDHRGTGYHIYFRIFPDFEAVYPTENIRTEEIEVGVTDRFLAVTGNHVQGTPRHVYRRLVTSESVLEFEIEADQREELDTSNRRFTNESQTSSVSVDSAENTYARLDNRINRLQRRCERLSSSLGTVQDRNWQLEERLTQLEASQAGGSQ